MPPMPADRTSVHGKQARTIAATSAAPRAPLLKFCATAAHTTSARPSGGIAYSSSMLPIIPRLTDTSTTKRSAKNAAAIRMGTPARSSHGARLKNSHHTAIAAALATPPTMPTITNGNPNSLGIARDGRHDVPREHEHPGQHDARPQTKRTLRSHELTCMGLAKPISVVDVGSLGPVPIYWQRSRAGGRISGA